MKVLGSTGLSKEVERTAACPYCKAKNKVTWPKGDKFKVWRIAIR